MPRFFHLRRIDTNGNILSNGGATISINEDISDKFYCVGIAECSLSDTFNKQMGRAKSAGRAISAWTRFNKSKVIDNMLNRAKDNSIKCDNIDSKNQYIVLKKDGLKTAYDIAVKGIVESITEKMDSYYQVEGKSITYNLKIPTVKYNSNEKVEV